MKIIKLVFISIFLFGSINPCYLWESNRDGERSCCLHLNGADICNPYCPCTRNVTYDLNGIFDYVARLLSVDKGVNFPYHKILEQSQNFIRKALSSGIRMYYRFDEYRNVKFYHEIAEATKSLEKTSKTSTLQTSAGTNKQKEDDVVTSMLVKMGLAWHLPSSGKNHKA